MTRARHGHRARLLPLLTAAMMVAAAGCGTSVGTVASATPGTRSDDVLGRHLSADEPGCSAAVGNEGTVVWAGAHGLADLAARRPLTPGSVFDIASVSKQFTATAILLLAQRGKLGLTDTVANYLDGLPGWSGKVTIAQLIHHTSGIPDYTGLLLAAGHSLTEPTTQAQAIQALADTPDLAAKPGAGFAYSNSNYLLLAEIVHAVTGETLPEFVRSTIFEPLNLDMVLDPLAQGSLTAISYTKDRVSDKWIIADSNWAQIGDGAIQTTPSQLVRWADNYRTGAVGGTRLLRDQTDEAVETSPGMGRYGAGIAINPDNTLSHNGAWGGFATLFGISADRRTAIAVSCNTPEADIAGIAVALTSIWTKGDS